MRAGRDQRGLVGEHDGLNAVAQAELGQDPADVDLDGPGGQVQPGGGLSGRLGGDRCLGAGDRVLGAALGVLGERLGVALPRLGGTRPLARSLLYLLGLRRGGEPAPL